MAVFYASASLSGAFSGLLAFAIEKMDGIQGLGGWQWYYFPSFVVHYSLTLEHRIFILEGLVPVAISFVIWKLLPDSPETARFLTKEEKEFVINRLAMETGSGQGRVTNADKIQSHHVWAGKSSKLIGNR
jgi:MFS family permease